LALTVPGFLISGHGLVEIMIRTLQSIKSSTDIRPAQKSVSIVMATYNGSKYIEEQLSSLIGQTLKPLEIIVSDDSSSDDTLEIVQRITAGCAIEIRLIRNEKALGFRDNFLRASLLARGDFIAFCDQDDIWDLDKLQKCSRYFDDRNIAMIVHRAETVDKDSHKIGEFRQGILRSVVKPPLSYDPWLTFFGFSIVYRRELLALADVNDRFIDYIVPTEMIAHDRWIMFLAQMVGSTAEIAEPLVKYRQHGNNVFGRGRRDLSVLGRDIKGETEYYIKSTSKMIEIVATFPDDTKLVFPEFDRRNCIDFLSRALKQLESRSVIYDAESRAVSLYRLYECIRSGRYKAAHNNRNRFRSIIRDLKFALQRS
jgi:glycosyltransferase involved in cell wall biosynthesis